MSTPAEYQAQMQSLMAMNIRLQIELTKALESVAEAHKKNGGQI